MAKRKKKSKPKKKSKNPVGRPPLYKTPAEMQKKIKEYFDWCNKGELKATMPGMAYYLGFSHREAMADTAAHRPEFSVTVTRARLMIESQILGRFIQSDMGMKFALQCNHDYVPKEAIEASGNVTINYGHRGAGK